MARLAERGWHLHTGIEPEFFLLRRDGERWLPADDARPARQALLRPAESLPRQQRLPARAARRRWRLRARRAADRPRRRARPVRAELRLRRRAGQRRPPDAVQAGRAGAGRSARHGVLDDAQALRQPAGQRHALPCVAVARARSDDTRNVFVPHRSDGASTASTLSPLGRHFIAGVLAHAAALTRAGRADRQLLQAAGRRRIAVRHELGAGLRGARARTTAPRSCARCTAASSGALPDASANPYLATAALIAAGLDGIERKLDPGPDCTDDLFDAAAGRRSAHAASRCCRSRLAEARRRAGGRRADLQRARRHAGARVRRA